MKSIWWKCILLASCAFLGFSTRALAQELPNFSGEWLSDSGQQLTVTHEPYRMTVREIGETFVYHLDGSKNHNESTSARGGPVMHETEARWAGSTIVVARETTFPSDGMLHIWTDTYVYHLKTDDTLSVTCFCATTTGGEHHRIVRTTEYGRRASESD